MDSYEEAKVDDTIDDLEDKNDGHELLKDLSRSDKLYHPINQGKDRYSEYHNAKSVRYIGCVVCNLDR